MSVIGRLKSLVTPVDRDQLPAAKARWREARTRWADRLEALARVRHLAAQVEPAEAAARAAAGRLAEATRAWAEAGAVGELDDSALLAAQRRADQALALARARAASAHEGGIAAAQEQAEQAQREFESAELQMRTAAAADYMRTTLAPVMAEYVAVSARLRELYATLLPFRQVVRPWGPAHRLGQWACPEFVTWWRAHVCSPQEDQTLMLRMNDAPLEAAEKVADTLRALCAEDDT